MARGIAAEMNGIIHSTDDLWYDEDGNYNWDAKRLGEMHRKNQQNVADSMTEAQQCIIVDNTNITNSSIASYLALAHSFEYDVQVVRVECDVNVAIERNADRP